MSKESPHNQSELATFATATSTESDARTLVLPLQTSRRKETKVRRAIEEYRELTSRFSDLLVSYPVHQQQAMNPSLYRQMKREFPEEDRSVSAKVVQSAIADVVDSFSSWRSRGAEGGRPRFKDNDYFAVTNQELTLVENARGYGLKVNFIPYKPEWFHIDSREYHRPLLERVDDDDDSARMGSAEIHLDDRGLRAHIPIRYDVEVYQADDVSTTVGVDLGESTFFAAAVVNGDGEVEQVEMESGAEFRHYRDRLDEKRQRLSQQGDLRGVRACRGDRERYTEQVCHTASRRIVDLARDHAPACIHLEDLTHYRRTASDPIHDWPFAQLQEQILYKATGAGIPVTKVDPRNTSITCRKCGQSTPEFRNGNDFHCRRCGYQVHADVNAAINIASVDG